MEFFEKNNTVNLNTSTILPKGSIWDACLGPKCFSSGGLNTIFKIQVPRYLAASKNKIVLKFRLVNCRSISRPLKQLSKVSVQSRSQKIFVRAYFSKLLSKHLWWSLHLLNFMLYMFFWTHNLGRICLKYENYSLRHILF